MFRNIFISLLILSALSSEGLANIPLNIYIYCDCDGNFGVVDGQAMPDEGCFAQNDMEVPESVDALNNNHLLLPAPSKVKDFWISDVQVYSLDCRNMDNPEWLPLGRLMSEKTRDLLLGKSDVSPPVFL